MKPNLAFRAGPNLLLLASAFAFTVACRSGGDGDGHDSSAPPGVGTPPGEVDCIIGELNCRCRDDATCDPGLLCGDNGICADDPSVESSETSTTPDSQTGSDSGTDSLTDSGSDSDSGTGTQTGQTDGESESGETDDGDSTAG